MKFDDLAAAYGLVQVVFADVTDRLASAVFELQRRRDASLNFSDIYRLEFTRLRKAFKEELKQFDGNEPIAADLKPVRDAVAELGTLGAWRNDRIHARVRSTFHGLALYDWRSGERLSINPKECTEVLEKLVKVIVTFEAHLPALFSDIDLEKALSDVFGELQNAEKEESA